MPTVMDETVNPQKQEPQKYQDPDTFTIYQDDGPHEVTIHRDHITPEKWKALMESERNGTKKGMPAAYQKKIQNLVNLLKERHPEEFQ